MQLVMPGKNDYIERDGEHYTVAQDKYWSGTLELTFRMN